MRLAFLDTETTGTSAASDRLIEIAVILTEDGKIIDTYTSLINPLIPISPFITEITGIKTSDLTNAPSFEDIALTLREFLSDSIIVAHNARFDYSFLRAEYRRLGIRFESPILCTVRLSRKLYPHHHHHNLDSIIKRFNFSVKNRHRAYDDAKVLLDFYNYLVNNFPLQDLASNIHNLLGHPSLPLNINDDTIRTLPHHPGVYIFYDQNRLPLYVGKSKDLKNRIHSHFYESVNSSKEMKLATLTHHIETRLTAGELSALILESNLIKELQPLHNRLLRQKKKMIALFESIDPNGYHTAISRTIDAIDVDQIAHFLGVFKSQKQLDNYLKSLCDEYQLCPKIMGLENSRSSCFAYHLGKCKGACKCEENPLFYNLRFQQAFSHSRLRRWPFPNPVLITEFNPDSEISKSFLVDQWCIISEFDNSQDVGAIHESPYPQSSYSFDLDTYKILLRFILDPANQSKIKILK